MNILVSACLLGVKCRYDGGGKMSEELTELMEGHVLIPVCPEQLGGLPTPRAPSERRGNRVADRTGRDVTEYFERGAEEVVRLAKLYRCKYAVLKERSPSCGEGRIYDGTFSGNLVLGDGIAAECLKGHGVRIFGESRIQALLSELRAGG